MSRPLVFYSPSETYEQALNRAADLFGIEREYWDIFGIHHPASAEGIAEVLRSMGIDAGSKEGLDCAVEGRWWDDWSRTIPPTLVASVQDPIIAVRVPRELADRAIDLEVSWEDGGTESARVPLDTGMDDGAAVLRGREFVARQIRVPFRLRLGYHELRAHIDGGEAVAARWILCPDRAYFPERIAGNGRAGGIFFSLYGLRSDRNWGCGDFTDLCRLAEWVATDLGASFIGLNPLHAIPNRQPYNTSPYLPVCSFYKNPIYLDLEAIEDFHASAWAQSIVSSPPVREEIARLRDAEYVEYENVQRLKLRVLKALFRSFLHNEYRKQTPRALEFRKYAETEGGLLDRFAMYCALDDAIHRSNPDVWLWSGWPAEYRDPESAATRSFAREHWRSVLFFKYIQWQLDLQLAAAQRHARELGLAIGLYHDLALATDRFGADLWAHRRFYVEGCRVGAPPDDFSPNGQDWSFPPPNALEHFRDGYRLFAESLRKNMKHGGALRIDHVMRFFHLFWIPDQLDAKRGIYIRDRHEDLVRILALESVRNQVLIVGEDLGTVADEIRETLARFGILSYKLFYFERRADGTFKFPIEYPEKSLVSASTHDLPTLSGFWANRDIEARRTAGMFPNDSGYYAQLADRMREKQKILNLLFQTGMLPGNHPRNAEAIPELTGELHYAIVGFLASTPSALMLLSEEDLMKQPDQQNLPGTTAEYPNWRHKTRFTVEGLRSEKVARDFAGMYRNWLARTGRANSQPT
jgi:4-alpha-glucanotransferase